LAKKGKKKKKKRERERKNRRKNKANSKWLMGRYRGLSVKSVKQHAKKTNTLTK